MARQISLNDYINPFKTVCYFNKAIIVVNQLYSKLDNNYKQVSECISQLVQPIDQSKTINFIVQL